MSVCIAWGDRFFIAIKEAAAGTGFIGGYVPHGGRRFVELVTQPYWYGVRQGDIFRLPGATPAGDAGAWGRQFEHFIDADRMVRDVTPEEWAGLDENDNFFDNLYNTLSIVRISASRAINSVGEGRGRVSELLISNFGGIRA